MTTIDLVVSLATIVFLLIATGASIYTAVVQRRINRRNH